ncbi:MAG TPA: signal recognition particle-docking protein FtsY [Sneathiellales bacterium]|nr:signal recognition particle-docking protein FtsY [Sneathiellales bacterium]
MTTDAGPENGQGFFTRLKSGLSHSKTALSDGIAGIFNKRKLDDDTLDELEDLLITSDIGVEVAAAVTGQLRQTRYNKEITADEVRAALAEEVASILAPVALPLAIDPTRKPHVILVVGVNGTGKTTTIGKLAQQLRDDGKSVMLAAGDTFRAAAIEQLQIWGERTNCPVVAGKVGADAAGLAFDALARARADNIDVLLVDTAGRLQNKANLMAELEKVVRVIRKLDADAPHSTLLVLDATTGQNALNQVEVFQQVADVSGLIMTKLDGTARGGILVAIARRFGLPIHAIGVGEGVNDMQAFDATGFAHALADVEINGKS